MTKTSLMTEVPASVLIHPTEMGGIKVYQDNDAYSISRHAVDILSEEMDRHSLLLMSYDVMLHEFYSQFAALNSKEPLAIMMAEEVFGDPYHLESCEHFLQKLGFIDAISKKGVPFFRILSRTPSMASTVRQYTKQVMAQIAMAEQTHVIVEVGADGRLGGILPACNGCSDIFSDRGPLYSDYVMGFSSDHNELSQCERITLTYRALEESSHIWAFAIGEDCRGVLEILLDDDVLDPSVIPASYLQRFKDKVSVFTDLVL